MRMIGIVFHGFKQRRSVSALLVVATACLYCSAAMGAEGNALGLFNDYVLPLLKTECYDCHSHESGEAEGGLVLDSRRGWEVGGALGPSVIPGKPDESWLVKAMTYEHDELQMPPGSRLPQKDIAHVRRWIELDAPDPRGGVAIVTTESSGPDAARLWSVQPYRRTYPEKIDGDDWSRGRIDRYLLARMDSVGLQPSADAPGHTLLARLHSVLTGLVPTPDEIDQFEAEYGRNPDEAVAGKIDELMDRPDFGIRWGRHWLDLARYADSPGTTRPSPYGQSWRYRNYVIDSPHFPAKAKRVIFLFMEGGPSQLDLIDYKPQVNARSGQPIPESVVPKKIREGKGEDPTQFGALKGSIAPFRQRGKSGLWISDLVPEIASCADDLCVLNGVVADSTEHGTATQQMHTGMPVLPRPSMGSWLLYGLGSENENLPGFVVVSPPAGSSVNCGTDFLPGIYQSTILRDADKPDSEKVRYLHDKRLPRNVRRSQLDFIQRLNAQHLSRLGSSSPLESLIEANELAFRMQAEAPEVLDIETESAETKLLYGIGDKQTDSFGRQCLLARRLAESGVRFIQVTSKAWDHHDSIDKMLPASCRRVDRPIAGLLKDLNRRGLLDDTLVVWTGEFGRTPVSQGVKNAKALGRGHNPFGFSLFMAGGGVKQGFSHGATDEFGYNAVEGRVHVHDVHATILHLMGLDHERLTYNFGGRDYRLTDVFGNVVRQIAE